MSGAAERLDERTRADRERGAMRISRLVLCLASLVMIGCAPPRPVSWTRADVAASEVNRDMNRCLRAATTPAVVNSKGRVVEPARISDERFVACMRSLGYESAEGRRG